MTVSNINQIVDPARCAAKRAPTGSQLCPGSTAARSLNSISRTRLAKRASASECGKSHRPNAPTKSVSGSQHNTRRVSRSASDKPGATPALGGRGRLTSGE